MPCASVNMLKPRLDPASVITVKKKYKQTSEPGLLEICHACESVCVFGMDFVSGINGQVLASSWDIPHKIPP